MTEDEMVRWHHRLNGHEFEQAPGDAERQRSLGCCSPWGCRESDTTEGLNNNKQDTQFSLPSSAHPALGFKLLKVFQIQLSIIASHCILGFSSVTPANRQVCTLFVSSFIAISPMRV